MIEVVESEFILNGFRYVAQEWLAEDPNQAAEPILALHGWLDNSASFECLAPLLVKQVNAHVLAPDLAGHGRSDHREGFSDYPIWSEVMPQIAIADKMGWQQFTLMGHSRGAMIALMVAALYPQRVSRLILIDALIPTPVAGQDVVQRMQKSMLDMQRRLQRPDSFYPTYEAAISARTLSEITRVEEKTAQRLARRGLTETEQGFRWHADDKLWAFGHVALSPEQIRAVVANVQAKTKVLLGAQGFKTFLKEHPNYLALFEELLAKLQADVDEFADGHYLHMEKTVDAAAASIVNFITDTQ